MSDNEIPESACTACGEKLDRAASFDKDSRQPQQNDFTICISCGHIMAFDENLRLRDLVDDELIEMASHPEMHSIVAAWHRMQKEKRK